MQDDFSGGKGPGNKEKLRPAKNPDGSLYISVK